MRDETSRLEETNARLQAEVTSLKEQLYNATRKNLTLAESKMSEADELQRALNEAKEQSAKRVSDTSQFQQMRKIMQSQSEKIKDLRRRLQKYEPENVKEDDDI